MSRTVEGSLHVSRTIGECRKRKAELEKALTQACYDFSCATGLKIVGLEIVDDNVPMESELPGSRGRSVFYLAPSVLVIAEL